ncbi:MAG: L,D-transpeptidase, partial [Lachnospiraceae bacterium]|nr:L,D-transpeptidase [Lachnospiraceae bacterium]
IKNFIKILTVPVLFLLISFPVNAASGFDPDYYAAKYPDVVAVYGTAPESLYNHYVTFGKKENRFQNAEEEAYAAQQAELAAQNAAAIQAATGYTTYVDVDINSQTVTCYIDGNAAYTCACVSGNVARGNDTPKGIFTLTTHTPGKYLKGPTWYCWVDYWMCMGNTQCGLHDASWRNSFGGISTLRMVHTVE